MNECISSVVVTSDNIFGLKEFTIALMNASRIPNATSFQEGWLGNILSYLGFSEEEIKSVPVNGEILSYDFLEDRIVLMISSANVPQLSALKLLADKVFGKYNYNIRYIAEEPATFYYVTNDPEFVGGACIITNLPPEKLSDKQEDVVRMLREFMDSDRVVHIKEIVTVLGKFFNLLSPTVSCVQEKLNELFADVDGGIYLTYYRFLPVD